MQEDSENIPILSEQYHTQPQAEQSVSQSSQTDEMKEIQSVQDVISTVKHWEIETHNPAEVKTTLNFVGNSLREINNDLHLGEENLLQKIDNTIKTIISSTEVLQQNISDRRRNTYTMFIKAELFLLFAHTKKIIQHAQKS